MLPLAIPGLRWLTSTSGVLCYPYSHHLIHKFTLIWKASLWYKEQSFNQLQGRSCKNLHYSAPLLLPERKRAERFMCHPLFWRINGPLRMAVVSPKQELPGEVIAPPSWSCRSITIRDGVCYDALENQKSALAIALQRLLFYCLVLQKESNDNLCPMPLAMILSNSVVQS